MGAIVTYFDMLFPFLFGRAFIEASFRKSRVVKVTVRDFPSYLEGLSLRQLRCSDVPLKEGAFPFLFGRAFIEAKIPLALNDSPWHFPSYLEGLSLRPHKWVTISAACTYFPSYLEGLSLRPLLDYPNCALCGHFPSYLEGLSLRLTQDDFSIFQNSNFPSYLEGLSLRPCLNSQQLPRCPWDFPSYLEGLSLRPTGRPSQAAAVRGFPFLFGRAFIEALQPPPQRRMWQISLPIWKGFH